MVRREHLVALVPAAGPGKRLGLGPKAFLRLGGRTLLEHVVDRLARCVATILVAVPEAEVPRTQALLRERAEVCAGRDARHDTVLRLFQRTTAPIVLIHDVSWPFASPQLIIRVVTAAMEHGAAAAVNYPAVPVGRLEGDNVIEPADTRRAVLPQSPQAYGREILEQAFRESGERNPAPGTTWEPVRQTGTPIFAVENEESNIQIATRFDWEIARKIIWPALQRKNRGFGKGRT